MIPEIYRWGIEQRRIYQSCDTMTHSGHRRKGLFQLLATRTYDEARAADPGFFAYGFGGPTSTPGFLKMGWRVELELPYLFQPFPLTKVRLFGGRAECGGGAVGAAQAAGQDDRRKRRRANCDD
jgi:hypothetical protein